jgi:NTP pyrophosphatase (non-canonical NTP hydrolase)
VKRKRPETSIESLAARVKQFRDARDWKQFHNPKDMALSLSLEVHELLELMQWKNGRELEEHLKRNRGALSHELADVLYWVLLLANDLKVDLPEALVEKLAHNEKKYPLHKSKGVAKKYNEL